MTTATAPAQPVTGVPTMGEFAEKLTTLAAHIQHLDRTALAIVAAVSEALRSAATATTSCADRSTPILGRAVCQVRLLHRTNGSRG